MWPLLVEYFATFLRSERRWRRQKKILSQEKKPHFFSTSAHYAKTLQNTQPMGAKKILLTQDKKNYSPTNEVTHPTETPLYLWYDVFMPPFLLLFFGEPPNISINPLMLYRIKIIILCCWTITKTYINHKSTNQLHNKPKSWHVS